MARPFMDDLCTHKIASAREAIEAVGACMRYLPAYSPVPHPFVPSGYPGISSYGCFHPGNALMRSFQAPIAG